LTPIDFLMGNRWFRCMGCGVPEWMTSEVLWGGVGTGAAWLITICLLLVGAIGCLLPVLPGHLLLFIAAVAHRLMLGADSGLQWWSFVILALLMAASQALEMLSGAAGAKWFGGSRWGAIGALVGGIAGMFFMPFGLLVGPLVGAIVGEMMVARREPRPAVVSGVGSVVGTLAGMGIKLALGAAMIVWFFLDVFVIG
jgi:uncharacterized protein YqgC (DUF456 family)